MAIKVAKLVAHEMKCRPRNEWKEIGLFIRQRNAIKHTVEKHKQNQSKCLLYTEMVFS